MPFIQSRFETTEVGHVRAMELAANYKSKLKNKIADLSAEDILNAKKAMNNTQHVIWVKETYGSNPNETQTRGRPRLNKPRKIERFVIKHEAGQFKIIAKI